VEKEELRLEAYRRLAAVTSHQEVDDIEQEWLDRYGPVPDAANALLEVAHLRAEAHRVGVREVAVARDTARISPIQLRTSQSIRLKRLYPKAVYKEDMRQVVLPLNGKAQGSGGARQSVGSAAGYVQEFLAAIIEPEEPSVAS
jgi:transcription-repair coupling factor (superfamily II helicase)